MLLALGAEYVQEISVFTKKWQLRDDNPFKISSSSAQSRRKLSTYASVHSSPLNSSGFIKIWHPDGKLEQLKKPDEFATGIMPQ